MVSQSLRDFAKGNKSVIGIFDFKQSHLGHMSENKCNNQLCTNETEQPYCSDKCRIAETNEHYWQRRRKRL